MVMPVCFGVSKGERAGGMCPTFQGRAGCKGRGLKPLSAMACACAQCNTEECVEAHTNVDVVVNLEELRVLLADRLPLVYAGYSVADAAINWPGQI